MVVTLSEHRVALLTFGVTWIGACCPSMTAAIRPRSEGRSPTKLVATSVASRQEFLASQCRLVDAGMHRGWTREATLSFSDDEPGYGFGVVWLPPGAKGDITFDGAVWRSDGVVVAVDARLPRGLDALTKHWNDIGISGRVEAGVVTDFRTFAEARLGSFVGVDFANADLGITLVPGGRNRRVLRLARRFWVRHWALADDGRAPKGDEVLPGGPLMTGGERRPLSYSVPSAGWGRLFVGEGVATLDVGVPSGGVVLPDSLQSLKVSGVRLHGGAGRLLLAPKGLAFLEVEASRSDEDSSLPWPNIDALQRVRAERRRSWAKALREHPNVSVVMRGRDYTADMVRALAPSCNVVGVHRVGLIDEEVARDAHRLKALRELGGYRATTAGLHRLRGHPALTSLSVGVHRNQLEALASWEGHLEELSLVLVKTDAAAPAGFDRRVLEGDALRTLRIEEGALGSFDGQIRLGPNVSSLTLGQRDVARFVPSSGLRELHVTGGGPRGASFVSLVQSASMVRRLSINGVRRPLHSQVYDGVGQMSGLYAIRITGEPRHIPAGDDELFRHLEGLSNLLSIEVGGTRVTDRGLARLPSLPRLAKLRLPGAPVTTSGLARLPPLPELRVLDLANTSVDADVVPTLVRRFPWLTTLRLDGVKLGVSEMNALLELEHLADVSFDGSDIDLELVQAFRCAVGGVARVYVGEHDPSFGLRRDICPETDDGNFE